MPTFTTQLFRAARGHVLAVAGELDIHAGTEVAEATTLATGQWAWPKSIFLVDVGRVTFVDCAGLGSLVRARADALHSGRAFQLRGTSPKLSRLISAAGLAGVFEGVSVPALALS